MGISSTNYYIPCGAIHGNIILTERALIDNLNKICVCTRKYEY